MLVFTYWCRKNRVKRPPPGLPFSPPLGGSTLAHLEETGFREACQDTGILLALGKFVLEPVSSFVKWV